MLVPVGFAAPNEVGEQLLNREHRVGMKLELCTVGNIALKGF